MQFLHIDRRGGCQVGDSLELHLQTPLDPKTIWGLNDPVNKQSVYRTEDLSDFIKENFSEGLSPHGWHYLTRNSTFQIFQPILINVLPPEENIPSQVFSSGHMIDHMCYMEIVFELVRQFSFPEKPSRFQSYFGCDENNLEGLKKYFLSGENKKIYRVETEKFFQADEQWLKPGVQIVGLYYMAHQYWKGKATPNPNWEYLLVPSVRVLEEVSSDIFSNSDTA